MIEPRPAAIPWRARMPWFWVWVPAFLLFYVVFNGAGHMEAAYRVINTVSVPSSETDWVFQTSKVLHGWWGLPAAFCPLVLACASWRLSPQWSASVRWLSRMLCALFLLFLILIQAILLAPGGSQVMRMAGPPSGYDMRRYLLQTWKPHVPWGTLELDLAEYLTDSDPEVRYGAIFQLTHLQAKEFAPEIARLLKDPVASVRREAAEALTELGATVPDTGK